MPPKRKIPFNPEVAKESAKKMKAQSSAFQEITDAAEAFLSAMMSISHLDGPIYSFKECVAELFLVGMLGIRGVNQLILGNKIVPENYPGRVHVITSLLNYTHPSEKQVIV